MNETVKKDIISALTDIRRILEVKEEKDVVEIRELSDHTIHNSSIFQDEDSISVAIFIYALSKIIERRQRELNYKPFLDLISKAIITLEKDEINNYRENMKRLFFMIRTIDTKLRMYVEEIIKQSKIKKAGRVFAHGISVGVAAEIMGISQWELSNYLGKTTMPEIKEEIINIRQRLQFTRGLFS
ncbi:MAG: hypothetical protein ABIJ08_05775 [Nanoarchaeota archaeon]